MNRRWLLGLAAVAWAGVAAPAAGAAELAKAPLDPARPGWVSVELAASKFLMSGGAAIRLVERPVAEIAGRLRRPPQGMPVEPGPRVLQLRYAGNLAGQRTDTTLLLDPFTAAALQFELRDSGRRHRQRIWRYTDIGAWHWTRKPATDAERSLEPAAWTELSEGLRRYPPDSGSGAVTDATALLYALSAAPLARPGDRYDLRVFSRRRIHQVRAELSGNTLVSVDYRQRAAGAESRRKEKATALRIVLSGTSVNEAGDDDERFSLLGLSDSIELALDPATRAPLQLTGSAPLVGRVTFRLKTLTLR
jgi:hypothetical protein